MTDLLGDDLSPAQFLVLRTLAASGPMPTSELANELAISCSAATMLCDPLESAGWLARAREAADRRVVVLTLTEAGKKRLAAAEAKRQAAIQRRLALLGETRVQQLLSLLQDWAQTFEDQPLKENTNA